MGFRAGMRRKLQMLEQMRKLIEQDVRYMITMCDRKEQTLIVRSFNRTMVKELEDFTSECIKHHVAIHQLMAQN